MVMVFRWKLVWSCVKIFLATKMTKQPNKKHWKKPQTTQLKTATKNCKIDIKIAKWPLWFLEQYVLKFWKVGVTLMSSREVSKNIGLLVYLSTTLNWMHFFAIFHNFSDHFCQSVIKSPLKVFCNSPKALWNFEYNKARESSRVFRS